MPRYQFVLKETPIGKANHDTHVDRRKIAKAKAAALLTYPVDGVCEEPIENVCEQLIGGDWYYTWIVDTPDMPHLWAFIRECTRHPYVTLSSGPEPVFSAAELSQIEELSHKLRTEFPDDY